MSKMRLHLVAKPFQTRMKASYKVLTSNRLWRSFSTPKRLHSTQNRSLSRCFWRARCSANVTPMSPPWRPIVNCLAAITPSGPIAGHLALIWLISRLLPSGCKMSKPASKAFSTSISMPWTLRREVGPVDLRHMATKRQVPWCLDLTIWRLRTGPALLRTRLDVRISPRGSHRPNNNTKSPRRNSCDLERSPTSQGTSMYTTLIIRLLQ